MTNGMVDVDYVAEATALKALKAEYQTLTIRMEEIKAEVKSRLAILNSIAPAGAEDLTLRGRRPPVEKPRPVSDKLSIAAGRAINIARKKKKTAEICKAEGIAAANKAAKKYGMDKLPADTLKLIDKKIKVRFNL